MIGRTVGNYVIQKLIGQGGMGAVYLAEHPRIGKRVAIKVLLPQLSQNAELVQRFFNEARAATAIANDHIIDVLDFGELPDGASYIVMEWLDGRSLASLLAETGKLPLPRAFRIARGIGEALAAAHAHGIVHRDLKPDNIFLVRKSSDPEFVKVLDFGIAKLLLTEAGGAAVQTRAGAIMGTPHYMSPEQCNGLPVDQRTDVYALGVILYEMIVGRPPFVATGLAELLMAHVSQPVPALRTLDGTIPPQVDQAVRMALAKSPDERFLRVEAFLAAIGAGELAGAGTLPPISVPPAPVAAGMPAPIPSAAPPAQQPPSPRSPTPPSPAQTSPSPSLVTVPPAVVESKPTPAPAKLPLGYRIFAGIAGVLLLVLGVRELRRAVVPAPETSGTSPAPAPAPPNDTPHPARPRTDDPVEPRAGDPVKPPTKKKPPAETWVLKATNCPPGALASRPKVTTNGNRVSIRAPGYADVHGTVDDDGDFVVGNQFGTCRGHSEDGIAFETCTAPNGFSCQATYAIHD